MLAYYISIPSKVKKVNMFDRYQQGDIHIILQIKLNLLELYETRPLLWDLQHQNYNDRDKRQQAPNEISESEDMSYGTKFQIAV